MTNFQYKLNIHTLFIFLVCLLLLAPTISFGGAVVERIKKNQELVLGTPGDFPPFTAISNGGQVIGFDIDLARNLAKSLNVKLTVNRYTFDELIPALTRGDVDIILSGITITPQRNLDIALIGPYGSTGQSFFGKTDIINSLESSTNTDTLLTSVAVLRGTTSELTAKALLPKATLIKTNTLDESVILLLNGEVDGIISDYPFCKLLEFRFQDRGFSLYDQILTQENLGIGISGDDYHFANIIENYLMLIHSQGFMEKMQNYWFKNDSWIKNLPDLDFFKDM